MPSRRYYWSVFIKPIKLIEIERLSIAALSVLSVEGKNRPEPYRPGQALQ